MSTSVSACKYLLERAQTLGRSVTVCHVLRYAPFYQKAKELAASGALGRIIALQASENVGYWHMTHSYVRGNWRRADETSPVSYTHLDVYKRQLDDSWKEEYLHQTENLCTRVCALRENRRHSDEYCSFKKPARSKPDEQI